MSDRNIKVRQGPRIFGPMSRAELSDLVAKGRVANTDQASTNGGPWTTVGGVLSDVSPAPSAPERNASPSASRNDPVAAATSSPSNSQGVSLNVVLLLGGLFLATIMMIVVLVVVLRQPAQIVLTGPSAPQVNAAQPNNAAPGGQSSTDNAVAQSGEAGKQPTSAKTTKTATPEPSPDPIVSSVGLICFVEDQFGGEKKLVPSQTAWVVGNRQLATRATRMITSKKLLGDENFELVVVMTDGVYDVAAIHFHPKFPWKKVGQQNTDRELEALFLNDVAVVEVSRPLNRKSLTLAKSAALEKIPTSGIEAVYYSVPKTEVLGEPMDYQPDVTQLKAKLIQHPMIARADARFGGVSGSIELHHDGGPFVNTKGEVIGVLSVSHNQHGVIRDVAHQIIAVDRVRELLAALAK